MSLLLVADIGGTHSRLALAQAGRLLPGTARRFVNDDHPGPAALLQHFLEETGAHPQAACLAGAGPLTGARLTLTNRKSWTLDSAEIARATGAARIRLLNDLTAFGYALALPEIAGSPLTATRLVLAPGTGINSAVAFPTPAGPFVPPSETGFMPLPFTTATDAPVLENLIRAFGKNAIEAALSGPGLARLHRALTGAHRSPAAITTPEPGCEATLALALRLLGAHLRALAHAHLPLGGIYLAGTAGRALFAHISQPDFGESFLAHTAYPDIIRAIPLRVITQDDAALRGAALAGQEIC